MVGGARGLESQAGDVCLPVLRRAAAVHEAARADLAGGRRETAAACAHGMCDGREARRAAALSRSVRRDAAAARRAVLSAAADSNPLTARTRTRHQLATSSTSSYSRSPHVVEPP